LKIDWADNLHGYIFSLLLLSKTSSVEDNYRERQEVFSIKVKAGKRRTYFFDVRATKGNDYYLIITESKKRFDSDQYERHKIFLYKEDFNKFLKGLEETVAHIKTELLPDYDFDAFENGDFDDYNSNTRSQSTTPPLQDEFTAEEEAPADKPASDSEGEGQKQEDTEVDSW
jgi:hypothetical protein